MHLNPQTLKTTRSEIDEKRRRRNSNHQNSTEKINKMALANNSNNSGNGNACVTCGHRVPITLRDLFWQDPFFSSNWEDFHKIHDDMMLETRAIWSKFDDQLKVIDNIIFFFKVHIFLEGQKIL